MKKKLKKVIKKLALQWHPDKFATKSESEKKKPKINLKK